MLPVVFFFVIVGCLRFLLSYFYRFVFRCRNKRAPFNSAPPPPLSVFGVIWFEWLLNMRSSEVTSLILPPAGKRANHGGRASPRRTKVQRIDSKTNGQNKRKPANGIENAYSRDKMSRHKPLAASLNLSLRSCLPLAFISPSHLHSCPIPSRPFISRILFFPPRSSPY